MMFRHEHILILVGGIQGDQRKRVVARFLDLLISLPAVGSEPKHLRLIYQSMSGARNNFRDPRIS